MLRFAIFSYQKGQSLLEVILAMAIFAFIALSMIALAVGSFIAIEQGGEHTQAEALAEEGIEAVRAIRDRAWNENIYTTSSVAIIGGQWIFSGESTTETIGQFTRVISFEDVCRDSGDNVTPCLGFYTDAHSKMVVVSVTWNIREGISNGVRREEFITNWDTFEWLEDLTVDFSDGSFSNTETSATQGDGDGAVVLKQL